MMLKEKRLQAFNACQRKWNNIINYLQCVWERVVPKFIQDKISQVLSFAKRQYGNIVSYFQITWAYFKPIWDKFLKAIIALTTMMSTFRVAGQLISMAGQLASILFSILPPVIATIPILGFISFSNSTMILILGGISLLAGYIKFKDLHERANLDNTILENKKEIAQLKAEKANVEERLKILNERVQALEQFLNTSHTPVYVPKYNDSRPAPSKSASTLTEHEKYIRDRNVRFLSFPFQPQPQQNYFSSPAPAVESPKC